MNKIQDKRTLISKVKLCKYQIMSKKIIVYGAAGLMGKQIVKENLKAGNDVIVSAVGNRNYEYPGDADGNYLSEENYFPQSKAKKIVENKFNKTRIGLADI